MDKKREGNTIVTSVSISKYFNEILKKFSISPTNAIRKGIAVELYELGIPQYITDLNKNRSEALKKLLMADEYGTLLKDIQTLERDLRNFKILMEEK